MRRSKSLLALTFAAALLGPAAPGALASVIIKLSDSTIAPGGVGTMDFTITTNAGDTLSGFSMLLQITPVGGSPSEELHFLAGSDQPNPYNDTGYVFKGASFKANNGPTSDDPIAFWGDPDTNAGGGETIEGGDSIDPTTADFVTIDGDHSYLGSVKFQAGSLPISNDQQYYIALLPQDGDSTDPVTYFTDGAGSPIQYSSNVATVTIQGSNSGVVVTNVVPEPMTLLGALAGLAALAGHRLLRGRGDAR